ncbi:hypothetical protein ACFPA8_08410 [Streptomyces ovatisporus]|uniref:Uncharacterized protein n=1 Tax=Streptomyces ovatisporus TaxID=1128682 RepID=A0ABV9A366_9ACTN
MSTTPEDSAVRPATQFWYDLPHGYLQLEVRPDREHLDEMARQILALPEDVRDRADQVFRLYALTMWEMQKHRVQGCAIGMHPDGRGDVATSVLTVSSVGVQGVNPKAVLATLMASGAGETADNGIVPLELPSGPGFLTESVRRSVVPGSSHADADEPEEAPVWQGMVAIPDTRASAIIALQLVTPSLESVDDFRNVLRGVASTVTFDDPAAAGGAAEPEPGSAAYAVKNDFG